MTSAPSDTPRSFWRKFVRKSLKADSVANAAGVIVDLRDEEPGFALPGRLFDQLPFAVYVCDPRARRVLIGATKGCRAKLLCR
jgi:hypothetical protein